jgi:hypothetical protein
MRHISGKKNLFLIEYLMAHSSFPTESAGTPGSRYFYLITMPECFPFKNELFVTVGLAVTFTKPVIDL